jgi:hypothetical protein
MIAGIAAILLFLIVCAVPCHAQNPFHEIICKDIGGFKKYNCTCSNGAGVLLAADHFGGDHTDITCNVTYHSMAQKMTVQAEVTIHGDPPDAIRWLPHEMDKDFRSYYGIPREVVLIKSIDDNTVYAFRSAGWDYRWLNGNKLIAIRYHDTKLTKPEPTAVVRAYLAKQPSTLSAAAAPDETAWIRDEMERRLWLSERWFLRYSAEKKRLLEEPLVSLNIFLDYREKYFGLRAADEKNVLTGYLNPNNSAGIKAKLAEYRNWWAENRGKEIGR